MYPFRYYKAHSLEDAVAQLGQEGAKLIAGGHSLLPAMKQRLAMHELLVDISQIQELQGIRVEAERLVIGAGVRHVQVASSQLVRETIPALAELAGSIGDPLVRNKGTLGGSISNNDPAADYPAALLGLAAKVVTTKGEHAADEFFIGMFETSLAEIEIVREVSFAVPESAAYSRFANPASRYVMAGAFIARHKEGVRVAISGAGATAFRAQAFEAALNASFQTASVSGIAVDPTDMMSDMHGPAEYRAQLVKVMVQRAVKELEAQD